MPYFVSLHEPDGKLVRFRGHNVNAEMSVPSTYEKWFDFSKLDGRLARDTIQELKDAADRYGRQPGGFYWRGSKKNVGGVLSILESWARVEPDTRWVVTN
jgi:hypothetical protein